MIPRHGAPLFMALAAAGVSLTRPWRRQKCLRGVNSHEMMTSMENTTDRLVLVPMTQLDDLLELCALATERLDQTDALRRALSGALAHVRLSATVEP